MPIIPYTPRTTVQAGRAATVNPASFGQGGAALQQFGELATGEVDQRLEQLRAVQLSEGRATIRNLSDQFLQQLDQDQDFASYAVKFEEFRATLPGVLGQQNYDPTVMDALQTDLLDTVGNRNEGLVGRVGIAVRDLALAREDDHNLAQSTAALNDLVAHASMPTANMAADLDTIGLTIGGMVSSGLITRTAGVELLESRRADYRYAYHSAAISRDPHGWLQAHGAVPTAPPQPAAAPPDDTVYAPEVGDRERGAAVFNRAVELFGDHARFAVQTGGPPGAGEAVAPMDYVRELARVLDNNDVEDTAEGLDELRELALAVPEPSTPVQSAPPPATPVAPMLPERVPIEGLTPEQADRLYARAEARAFDMDSALRADVAARVEDEVAALQLGIPVTDPLTTDQVMRAYRFDPASGTEVMEGLQAARSLAGEFEAMHGMSNAELEAMIADERAALEAGGPDLATRMRRAEALQGQAQKILGERGADLPGYVLQQSPELAERFATAFADGGTASQQRAVIRELWSRQGALAADAEQWKPFPAAMMDSVLDTFRRAEDMGDKTELLMGLTVALDDEPMELAVMDQLIDAGINPFWRHVVSAPADSFTERTFIANMLMDSGAMDRFKEQYSSEADRNHVLRDVNTYYEAARGHVYADLMGMVGSTELLREIADEDKAAATQLAIAILARTPEQVEGGFGQSIGVMAFGDTSTPAERAIKMAIDLLYKDEVPIDSAVGAAFVPRAQGQEIVEGMQVAREMLHAIDPLTYYADFLDGAFSSPVEQRIMRATWTGRVDGARWINHQGNFALVMPTDGPGVRSFGRLLVDAQGNIRTWTAEELVALAPLHVDEQEALEQGADIAVDALVDGALDAMTGGAGAAAAAVGISADIEVEEEAPERESNVPYLNTQEMERLEAELAEMERLSTVPWTDDRREREREKLARQILDERDIEMPNF